MPPFKIFLLSVFSLLLFPPPSFAFEKADSTVRGLTGFENINESQPLWEFGIGGGAIDVANYPASSERNFVALAAPYLIYRGDIFRIGDENGVRAVVIETSDFELDLSFGGAFPADSEDNTARAGMPELDFLFEIGPQLIYKIKDYKFAQGGNARLKSRLQARAVFSTDFQRIDQRGFVFEPTLSYQQRGVLFQDTALKVEISLSFASEQLHDYFYQVTPEYSNSTREQYNAEAGYLGADISIALSFPVRQNLRVFFSGSARFHQGSANQESPLYEEDINYSFGLGFVWRMYESDTKANW